MKYRILLTIIIVLPLLAIGCKKQDSQSDRIEFSILKTAKELNLNQLSYIISSNGETRASNLSANTFELPQKAYDNMINRFVAPILLKQALNDSLISEAYNLKLTFPTLRSKTLKPEDLIELKANMNEPTLEKPNEAYQAISRLVNKLVKPPKSVSLEKFKYDKLQLEKKQNIKTIFQNTLKISRYFDDTFIEYSYKDTTVKNLYPTWYTENIVNFFGWNVFKYQGETILWASFDVADQTILFIKVINRNLFLAVSSVKEKIFSTDYPHKNDLLQSPVALAVLRALYLPKKIANLDLTQKEPVLNQDFSSIKREPYRILLSKSLLPYARFFEKSGNRGKANELYKVYKQAIDNFPDADYLNKSPIAEINYVTNNSDVIIPFEIAADTTVSIFSAGQMMEKNDYNHDPDKYDHVQIYVNKNKDPNLIKQEDLRLFQFNYGLQKASGNRFDNLPDSWLVNSGVRFAFDDPTDTSYTLELKIPWAEMNLDADKQQSFVANLFIGDSDLEENYRKSMLSWVVKSNEYWNDASKYGKITLTRIARKNTPMEYFCKETPTPPVIDGKPDPIWNNIAFADISIPYIGKPSASDNSAKFKTLYDKNNVYFLVNVVDNCKNKAGIITRDKCWIENSETHDLVWKMNGIKTVNAPTFLTTTQKRLKKGKYFLRYRSDEGHSFEGFYGIQPISMFYGAQIYFATTKSL